MMSSCCLLQYTPWIQLAIAPLTRGHLWRRLKCSTHKQDFLSKWWRLCDFLDNILTRPNSGQQHPANPPSASKHMTIETVQDEDGNSSQPLHGNPDQDPPTQILGDDGGQGPRRGPWQTLWSASRQLCQWIPLLSLPCLLWWGVYSKKL